jgi:glycosyltransferase involved in cell wall biosynthesis
MRVAMFSYGLPVRHQKRGGIERVAHELAQGLAARGHDVVVFTHDPAPAEALYNVQPLPWKGFVDSWVGRRLTMGYLGNVLAVLPDYRSFDVVIAHGDSLLLPLARRPLIRVLHGSAFEEAMHASSPGRFLLQCGVYVQELTTALFQSGTVAVSENTKRGNPFVHRVIANGVNTQVFRPTPPEKTPVPSIVFVGAQRGRKRGQFLLDLFATRIKTVCPDAQLMFVGPSGPAIAGVTYHTGVGDDELASLYRRAWVCASPSSYEGFGLPYLEAMACGTAVVATANPGSLEVLDEGRFGRVVSDEQFASAVLALLQDAGSRRALEAAGIRRADEFSLSRMIDRYEQLLTEIACADAQSIPTA